MGKYALIVVGPAGSGKSTLCYNLQQHCQAIRRPVHVVNLDPAAEEFRYPVSIDVRDLVTLEDVMDEMELGPNGGLVYCMEYLEEHLHEWLSDELEPFGDEDFIVFDCPGQIELYSHVPVFRTFVDYLKGEGWNVCCVYCLDSHFVTDPQKFIAGTFQALSAMVSLELPHINVLTKCDLVEHKDELEAFRFPEGRILAQGLSETMPPSFKHLNDAVGRLLDDFGMVAFHLLDPTEEDSMQELLGHIDVSIQFGDDADVKIANDDEEDQEDSTWDLPS